MATPQRVFGADRISFETRLATFLDECIAPREKTDRADESPARPPA